MKNFDINYPSLEHRIYLEAIYEYCEQNNLSLLLKGSLSNKTATIYSDIDLIILGEDIESKIFDLINIYGKPVMTNLTTNPSGIVILIYKNGICVDMDIRKTISSKELNESMVLLDIINDSNVNEDEIERIVVNHTLIPTRPKWYRLLRLIHRGTIKYLSKKYKSAITLLSETKESLEEVEIYDLEYKDNFEEDIRIIFYELCKKYKISNDIKLLFNILFNEF